MDMDTWCPKHTLKDWSDTVVTLAARGLMFSWDYYFPERVHPLSVQDADKLSAMTVALDQKVPLGQSGYIMVSGALSRTGDTDWLSITKETDGRITVMLRRMPALVVTERGHRFEAILIPGNGLPTRNITDSIFGGFYPPPLLENVK